MTTKSSQSYVNKLPRSWKVPHNIWKRRVSFIACEDDPIVFMKFTFLQFKQLHPIQRIPLALHAKFVINVTISWTLINGGTTVPELL